MKRTDVVEEIVACIDQWEPEVRAACWIGTLEELAEVILHRLEINGRVTGLNETPKEPV